MPVQIRPAEPSDAAAVARLWREVTPQIVKSAAAIEAALRADTSRYTVVALVDGETVGHASATLPDPAAGTRPARLNVQVLPSARRAGAGSALAGEVIGVAEKAGARTLLTVVADEDAARDFAVRRGFTIERPLRFARVALTEIPDPLPAPDGLRLVAFEELTDPRQVYDAAVAVVGNDPSGLSTMPAYEEWLAAEWQLPDHALDLSLAVLDGDTVVSFVTTMADRERGAVWSNLTGTRPGYGGRGLAKVVKSHALARSRAAGMTEALAGNDANNKPMLAVNDWLGYRAAGAQWTATRTLH